MSEKCLLDQWRDMAYDRNLPKDQLEKFWGTYFTIEREIYEQLLENPDEEVKGTVKELAEKYGQDVMTMVGFLDGINDSLKTANPIETMEEYMKGCVKGEKDIIFVNVSWGLGIGIIIDGKIYTGKSGFSGEFGHTNVFDNEIICHCGKKGNHKFGKWLFWKYDYNC